MAHILITNDDGIQAEGLRALVHAVEGLGTISVVAPSHEARRDGRTQSLNTLRQPIFGSRWRSGNGRSRVHTGGFQ